MQALVIITQIAKVVCELRSKEGERSLEAETQHKRRRFQNMPNFNS